MSRYDKERVIGSGTFGNVWLVKSKLSRQSFVLKEINLNSLNETEQRQALTEAEVLSKCKHKNIIRHREAFINENKYLIIVMEYAEGGDLYTEILAQNGTFFSEKEILSWFIQICLALQYIHFKNIIHRDLKTQNIFLTRNKTIKIGDFGIARFLQGPEELVKTAIGTPYYLSPEIFQRKPYNHKSDIWALGCVLFEMAALEHAFKANDFFQLANSVLCGKRRELPRKCSPIVRELVHTLLKIDPEDRPSTDEILAYPALQPFLFDFTTSHGARENMFPVLTGQWEKNLRRCSIGLSFRSVQDNSSKRRASISTPKNKTPKRANPVPKETVKARPTLNARVLPNKNCPKRSPMFSGKLKQVCEFARNAANRTFSFGLDETEKQDFTVSCDTYVLPTTNHKSHPNPSPKLSESDDSSLSSFYGGKNAAKRLSNPESRGDNSQYDSSFYSDTTKLAAAEVDLASDTCSTLIDDQDDVFGFSVCKIDDTLTNESRFSDHDCCHSRCHQCMLDTLWKNRIRCCVGVSVDTDEYHRLKSRLYLVYRDELFRKVYKSLIYDWDGNEDASKKNKFQALMNSLNYDQVQSLPLMMQFIQLDLLLKSTRD